MATFVRLIAQHGHSWEEFRLRGTTKVLVAHWEQWPLERPIRTSTKIMTRVRATTRYNLLRNRGWRETTRNPCIKRGR